MPMRLLELENAEEYEEGNITGVSAGWPVTVKSRECSQMENL